MARTIHRAAWLPKPAHPLAEDVWELYDTKEDFSLSTDVSSKNPDKLKELQALFMSEGEKYHVLPIDDRLLERTNAKLVGRPTVMGDRTSLTLGEGMRGMGVDIFIDTRNTSYTITSIVEVSATSNGVMVCQGGRFGGFSFYIKNGKPSFTYNFLGLQQYTVASSQALKPGKHTLVYDFKYDGGGMGKGGDAAITIDGARAAGGRIEKTQPGIFSVDDLADVGTDDGTWVADYGASAKFSGHLEKVTLDVHPAVLSAADKAKEDEMHHAKKEAE
jgi:arylsulfatase